jgi:hypothetical protein
MKITPEISPREAAIRLGIRLDSLYPLLRIGRLAARKKDGRWLVNAADVASRARKHFWPPAKRVVLRSMDARKLNSERS